jgi:hypothetical protein
VFYLLLVTSFYNSFQTKIELQLCELVSLNTNKKTGVYADVSTIGDLRKEFCTEPIARERSRADELSDGWNARF